MSSDSDSRADAVTLTGTVTKKSQGIYTVGIAGRSLPCALSSRLRKVLIYPTAAPTSLHHRVREVKDIKATDPVAVGDRVQLTDAGDGTGLITEVLPRRTALTRRAALDHGAAGRTSAGGFREQVIVANADQVVAVLAVANPLLKWELLDRYLVAAELAGLPTLICLTKADLLADDTDLVENVRHQSVYYHRLGYAIALVSTVSGAGLADLRESLAGRLSVFVGKSGVGKTSLLNAIQPGLGQRVKSVNAVTGKGKHTTTHVELFDLNGGGQIVDTPGMREFGLDKLDEVDVAFGFVEMRPLLGTCRFGLDCTHAHEPGCAIKRAVEAGDISSRRYASFLRIREG